MKVNDRVTVKTDGGPRREGVVLEVEEFSEGGDVSGLFGGLSGRCLVL